MKHSPILTILVSLSLIGASNSYAGPHDDHSGHDHSTHAEESHDHASHQGHDHASHGDHNHGDHEHEGHDHGEAKAGPNGGRLITSVEPHLEFFVTSERKIQLTFLNDADELVAPGEQIVSLIGGDRQNPVRLRFVSDGSILLSDQTLPEGNNLPVILSIKPDAKSQSIRERFNLNLSDCPTCDYLEYACICEHGEGDHEGHNH